MCNRIQMRKTIKRPARLKITLMENSRLHKGRMESTPPGRLC